MIEVKNLKKYYGTTRAVDGVSFSMKDGEILGFLGPNGAGKSTTMKVLTGYLPMDSGEVKVAGFDVEKQSFEARQRLGYLPENTPLYEDMGVIEFLRFVAAMRKISRADRPERIGKVIEMTGLKGVTGKTIGQLSRGYRQRVGLAQALIHDPEILILDEPTSALDPTQINEIRDLIRRIGREKSIILSTHIMQEVTATCDRAIIINQGRVIAEGTPDELIGRGSAGRILVAEIQGAREKVAEALKALPGIDSVGVREVGEDTGAGAKSGDGGWFRYTIACGSGAKDPAVDVFREVAAKGWLLRSLQEEKATLEEVFIKLTKEGAGSGNGKS